MDKNKVVGILVFLLIIAVVAMAYFAIKAENPEIIHSKSFELAVGVAPDFTIEIEAPSQTFVGRGFPIGITLTGLNLFAGDVELSVEGLPQGSMIEYFPSQIVTIGYDRPYGAQINVTIPPDDALAGNYKITVTARSTKYN